MRMLNDYLKETFGEKLYKISLDGGFTCPNRDGTCGTKGCIFCSSGGSGEFAASECLNLDLQIENAKARVTGKYKGSRYIAYFQAFTNTYAPVHILRKKFMPVILRDDIAALSIATRPDCLPDEVLALLAELNSIKPVWIELGLQTSNDITAQRIRRGYTTEVYDQAMTRLQPLNLHRVTHQIIGLPGETPTDMLETTRHIVSQKSEGIKFHLLHILRDTDLAEEYYSGKYNPLDMDAYISLLADCVETLPESMIVHRLTGDGDKRQLIAPLWSADKKHALNAIRKKLFERQSKP